MEEIPPLTRKAIKKDQDRNLNKKNSKKDESKKRKGWIFFVTVISFISSAVLMYFSSVSFNDISILSAFLILIIIIVTGIVFDIFGVAVTSAQIKVFHSMAACKIKGSKQGILLIKNADKVSNFCNDVVGDICGIISGACGSLIIFKLVSQPVLHFTPVNIIISGGITAFTVCGKALGKYVAIQNSNDIVLKIGKFINLLKKD